MSGSWASAWGSASEPGRPHVLFIAIDDLNDYISPLDNHSGVKTPHFARLAKRSVTFANAHCAAPACHPSRVAVMTGVHPVNSGIYRNMFGAHGPRWRHESPALEKAVVLSQHFRNHGYRAAGGGKIFHTLQWTPGDSQNDPEAWDDYRGDPLDPISADWPRPELVPDSEAGLTPGRPLGGNSQLFGAAPLTQKDEEVGDHLVVDWAIDQMHRDEEKPLFLAVGLFRPHIPWEVPQKWFDMYPIEDVELPPFLTNDLEDAHSHGREGWHKWVTDNDQWKHMMQGYLASISYVDHQLGRLLDALDQSPLKDNTIIVVWSDHGFHIGEKENWEKFALWDQTTRVPLFIHAPGVSKDGVKTRVPTTLTDLYPTLCDLAGLPVPSQCDGTSLLPQLKSPTKPRSELSLTSFQFWGGDTPSHAVSDERYRFIKYGSGFEELYDLRNDPNEFVNRADDPGYRDIRERLARGVPSNVAPMRAIPTDSPHHRGRQQREQREKSARKEISIAGQEISVIINVTPDSGNPDGVLVSHGGDVHGYSIYVRDGRLCFAVRLNRKIHEIRSRKPVAGRSYSVQAALTGDGTMSLSLDFLPVAYGHAGSLILSNPNEGQTIGSDPGTPVGTYTSPFRFPGTLSNLEIITSPVANP